MVLNVIGNQNGVNLTNNATVYYQGATGEVNGGSSTTTTRVIEPDLQIIKTASTNIKPGDICTFTLNISHKVSSTSNAHDLIIVDNIPAGMTYLDTTSLPGAWTADATQTGKIIFNGPALLLGQNATIIFRCTVNNNASLAGTNITNIANLTYSSLSGNDTNERIYNTSGSSVTHILGADIFVTKNAPATIYAGQQINFTINVGNNGPDTAVNVVLNDLIDPVWFARMNNVQYRLNGTWYNLTNPITLNLGNISSLSNITILVRGIINSSAPVGTLNNSVNVTTDTPDPIPGNNSAQTSTTVQQLADIVVDKNGPATVIAGNNISYTISVTNNGPSDALNVHLFDSIPAQLINIIYSTNGVNWISWPPAGGFIDLGTLIANQSSTVWVNATVPSSTANGTVLNNSVNATTTTPVNRTATDSVNTTVNTQADLQVDKNGPSIIIAGNQIFYTISVTNNGPSDALNVQVYDNVPAQLTNVKYSLDGINWINWPPVGGYINLGTILANITNNTRIIYLNGIVNPSTANGTELNNTVNVTTTTPDPTPNIDTVITTVESIADIHVSKLGPASAIAGQDVIKYTISVGNNGPSVAHSTMLYDNITFLSNVQYSLNDVNWSSWTGSLLLGELNPGSVTNIFIRGLLPANASGTLNNTVTVNTTSLDEHPENNTASALTNVNTTADVYVVKSVVGPVVAGLNVTYNLLVGNVGPSVARDVVLTDLVPVSVLNPVYSVNGVSMGIWSGSYLVGNLTPGSLVNVTISGLLSSDALGVLNNTGSVNSSTFDNFTDNNTSNVSSLVNTTADVYVVKTGPVIAIPGKDVVTYVITVGNNGPSDAREVVLTDSIPPVILSPLYSMDNGFTWNTWSGNLSLGNMTPGNVFEILIRGALSSSATQAFNNTAIINSSTYDPILENNTSTAEVKIKTADIAVIKSVNVSNPKYWSNVVFTICTINNGPNGATGVSIKDILPAGLKFISYTTTQGTYNHNTGIWDIGSLNNGSYVWLNIAAQVVKSNTAIINIASKYSENEYDPYPENDSDNATVHVAAAADLGIKKTVSAKSAYFGKKLYFTIIVQNWGPDTSTGVKVKDVLPKGLRFVSYTTNYGKYNHKTGIWNINLLPAHKIAKLTITFYGVRSGKKINVARVSSKTYDPIIRPGDSKVSSATVLIKRPKCHYHPHHSHQNTVPMQHTGLPFAALIMAILMIMGGFISSKKTKKITK
ncbi:MAG: hypothetical protein Q7U35_03170 [Methanobacteriaceae archaeon]|nr:hypothetical protein [Methanobacteriaceae archaeon]